MTRDLLTELIHHPYEPPDGFEAAQVGVYKASTVIFPDVAAMRARNWKQKAGYTYGLHGTPTTFTLEERVATLEGGVQALLAPSGLAAIAMVNLALLKQGDEVLLPDNVYGSGKELVRGLLAGCGITHKFYDGLMPETLAAAMSERTKLVWIEAAGSVTMEFPDVRSLVRTCRERGVACALDNTWGAGLAFRPFDLGDGLAVDISMQALTKYASGGGDVLMGAVVTRDEELHQRIKRTHMQLGLGVGANDVEAVLRSLPSIALRYEAQDRAARQLARWCASRHEIARTLHPALPGSPGHDHWKALCGSAAGLFSVVFDAAYGQDQVDAFVDALQLFRIGYSWGGPVSLVMPYDVLGMRTLETPYRGSLVRFSIGLEAVADLQADLERALAMVVRTENGDSSSAR